MEHGACLQPHNHGAMVQARFLAQRVPTLLLRWPVKASAVHVVRISMRGASQGLSAPLLGLRVGGLESVFPGICMSGQVFGLGVKPDMQTKQ